MSTVSITIEKDKKILYNSGNIHKKEKYIMFEKSKWIKSPDFNSDICPIFKKNINVNKKITNAFLTATAMGLYYVYINGIKVGERLFTPGFTNYNERLLYQTYDITDILQKENSFEMLCGPGWAVGSLAFTSSKKNFAENVSAIFEIVIEYEDGTSEKIFSDENTEVYNSHILYSDIYHGEHIDYSFEKKFLGNALISEVKTVLIEDDGEEVK